MVAELSELDPSAFEELMNHLASKKIHMNRYRSNSGLGRSQCYGIVRKRSMAPDLSRCSWKDAKMHYLLMKFARAYVPIPFTSVQVNENYATKKHKDTHNVGESYIVAFGNYEGGDLVLYNKDETKKEYNIRHRPLLFNGSQIEHSTNDFTGLRYSLVFHTTEAPLAHPQVRKLEDYQAMVLNGEWVICWYKQGEPCVYLTKKVGLDHPLKGRKKKEVEEPKPLLNPNMTAAQNLLLSVLLENGKDYEVLE